MDKRQKEAITQPAETSEKAIERYLLKKAKEVGAVALKNTDANMTGYPDRVLLFPNGKTWWVEVKGKRGKLSKIQTARISQLEKLGQNVAVVRNKQQVEEIIKKATQ